MRTLNFSLEGKVAVVTGGRQGIGKAIALAFAEVGADVAICDLVIDDGQLEAVSEEIKSLGRRSLAAQADVSKKTDVDNFVNKVTEQFGGIDIWVNNAGIVTVGSITDVSEDDWDRTIDVNLKSGFLCCQAISKRFIEQKHGNIINIASHLGIKAKKKLGAYCVAKTGVVMLTRVLALEMADYNIRVNAIAPGPAKTKISWRITSDPEALKATEATIPLGRMAETSDIVGAAVYLASDASSFVTGHTIVADGGLVA